MMTKKVTRNQRSGETDTAEVILDIAEQLLQTRSFNGFSYADVAVHSGLPVQPFTTILPAKVNSVWRSWPAIPTDS
jgi:AcrR family transcriptional regulator